MGKKRICPQCKTPCPPDKKCKNCRSYVPTQEEIESTQEVLRTQWVKDQLSRPRVHGEYTPGNLREYHAVTRFGVRVFE